MKQIPRISGISVAGASKEIVEAAMKGLAEAGADIFALSQERVPVLDPAQETKDRPSGELKESADLTVLPKSHRVRFRYGTPYAVYQHERMDLKHPTGGQAKFLESSMLELREAAGEKVADAVREVTGGA